MIGRTVSHYRILDRLGGGGMGVVYRAIDLKLDRPVALKFLSSQRGAAEEHKRRFIREARTASALDHPNICTVYEIDETADGEPFIAMALYEGETLRERIARGPLAIPEAVEIAEQTAAGLAWAHERGIVHRDVKPGNVIVTPGGRVKIVDFGIARLADQSRITRAGMAMGTAAYMSPEQVQSQDTDPRTDVWSLGVMIYEMVTGRLPFAGGSETELLLAVLTQPPAPMTIHRSGVPPALERLVLRALAKHPGSRYPSMRALSADLRSLAAATATTEPPPAADENSTLLELPVPSPAAGVEGTGGKVDRYEILELLGGGGMGVVYKARDTRLSRTVALKFLPPELTRDPRAKERFEQEARAASSLDHPNLCTILELGDAPDGRLYIAMPCYDGETLRRRLERGPLPVGEAVDVATQIARGLAKAHRSGIVHRDVKPANLIVTADGVVKILDFGLATLAGQAAVSRAGSSAGTPAYMSPEQARGDTVDARTDLWSLGVVLYEMLAGRRPFRGEREPAVIYSILHEQPQPLRELRPEVPPELARIVERLLAKAPEDRYPAMEALSRELRILQGISSTDSVSTVVSGAAKRSFPSWVGWGLSVALAAGLIISLFRPWATGGNAHGPLASRFIRLTYQPGAETFPSLSSDGSTFVYAKATSPDNLDISLQRVGDDKPVNLTGDSPVDDTQPAFSPDGRQIAFRSEREGGGIFLMPVTGRPVRRLMGFGFNPAWSPDGKTLAVSTSSVVDPKVKTSSGEIWEVDVATGRRRQVREEDAVQPSWSPHGWRLAYWGWGSGESKRALYTIPAQGGKAVQVTDDLYLNWSPTWSPDGRFLYFASDRGGTMSLWRAPIDERSGSLLGEPEPVATPSPSSGLPSFSRDGRRMLYASNDSTWSVERAAFDPVTGRLAGPFVVVTQGSRAIATAEASPDGQWIAFDASAPYEDLFIIRPDGSGLRRLTNDIYKDRNPRWSPSGDRIVFHSNRSGVFEAWAIHPDGSGLEQLTKSEGGISDLHWWPDGRRLICSFDAALIDLSRPLRGRTPVPLAPPEGQNEFFVTSISQDGRRLAGEMGSGGGERQIAVYSLDPRSYAKYEVIGHGAVWCPDGERLLYRRRGKIFLLDTRTKKTSEVASSYPGSFFSNLDLSRDGRFLTLVRTKSEGDIWMIEKIK